MSMATRTDNEIAKGLSLVSGKIRSLTMNRDRDIRLLHDRGWSLREIAEVVQLSHQTVSNILNRD